MSQVSRVGLLLAVVAVACFLTAAGSAEMSKFRNCRALNAHYPHGVGRTGAHDHTSSGNPVTDLKRSNRLYLENRSPDRDKDGSACEKH
jgi:hypothetical protein